jgi:hypothetical protein
MTMISSKLLCRSTLVLGQIALFALAACGSPDPTVGKSTSDLGASTGGVTCNGALPQICEVCSDGSKECAHWVVENGKCEVEICPAPTTPKCTGALPQICEVCSDGSKECAHWVVENGKCEVEICPSSPPPVCSGGLPQICEVCSDGTSECAHWVVVGGKCEVEICPGSPSPVTP